MSLLGSCFRRDRVRRALARALGVPLPHPPTGKYFEIDSVYPVQKEVTHKCIRHGKTCTLWGIDAMLEKVLAPKAGNQTETTMLVLRMEDNHSFRLAWWERHYFLFLLSRCAFRAPGSGPSADGNAVVDISDDEDDTENDDVRKQPPAQACVRILDRAIQEEHVLLRPPPNRRRYQLSVKFVDRYGHAVTSQLGTWLRTSIGADVSMEYVTGTNEQVGFECGYIAACATALAVVHGLEANFRMAAVGQGVNIERDNACLTSWANEVFERCPNDKTAKETQARWERRRASSAGTTHWLDGVEIFRLIRRDFEDGLVTAGFDADTARGTEFPIPVQVQDFAGLCEVIMGSYIRAIMCGLSSHHFVAIGNSSTMRNDMDTNVGTHWITAVWAVKDTGEPPDEATTQCTSAVHDIWTGANGTGCPTCAHAASRVCARAPAPETALNGGHSSLPQPTNHGTDGSSEGLSKLLERMAGELPRALRELRAEGRKTSHWAWWAFPTEKEGACHRPEHFIVCRATRLCTHSSGASEPPPKTRVTRGNAPALLARAPDVWREVLEKVCSLITTQGADVLPSIDHDRVRFFVKFWSGIESAPDWLSTCVAVLMSVYDKEDDEADAEDQRKGSPCDADSNEQLPLVPAQEVAPNADGLTCSLLRAPPQVGPKRPSVVDPPLAPPAQMSKKPRKLRLAPSEPGASHTGMLCGLTRRGVLPPSPVDIGNFELPPFAASAANLQATAQPSRKNRPQKKAARASRRDPRVTSLLDVEACESSDGSSVPSPHKADLSEASSEDVDEPHNTAIGTSDGLMHSRGAKRARGGRKSKP